MSSKSMSECGCTGGQSQGNETGLFIRIGDRILWGGALCLPFLSFRHNDEEPRTRRLTSDPGYSDNYDP